MAWRSSGVVAERVRAAALEAGEEREGGVGDEDEPPACREPERAGPGAVESGEGARAPRSSRGRR
jgi:hypothetical protein